MSGTPYAIEPDPTVKTLIVISMMPAHLAKPTMTAPDVTCPGDAVDSDRRDEVVHHEKITGQAKKKKLKDDKKPLFTIQVKSILAIPKTVAARTAPVRERWLESIHKEIESFLLSMAISNADPAGSSSQVQIIGQVATTMSDGFRAQTTSIRFNSLSPTPQMRISTSRLVICGNFAAWSEQSPPPILVKMNIVQPNTVRQVKKAAVYGLREAPRPGKENETNNFRSWYSTTSTTRLTLYRVISIQAKRREDS